jgi:hypothetical protein
MQVGATKVLYRPQIQRQLDLKRNLSLQKTVIFLQVR